MNSQGAQNLIDCLLNILLSGQQRVATPLAGVSDGSDFGKILLGILGSDANANVVKGDSRRLAQGLLGGISMSGSSSPLEEDAPNQDQSDGEERNTIEACSYPSSTLFSRLVLAPQDALEFFGKDIVPASQIDGSSEQSTAADEVGGMSEEAAQSIAYLGVKSRFSYGMGILETESDRAEILAREDDHPAEPDMVGTGENEGIKTGKEASDHQVKPTSPDPYAKIQHESAGRERSQDTMKETPSMRLAEPTEGLEDLLTLLDSRDAPDPKPTSSVFGIRKEHMEPGLQVSLKNSDVIQNEPQSLDHEIANIPRKNPLRNQSYTQEMSLTSALRIKQLEDRTLDIRSIRDKSSPEEIASETGSKLSLSGGSNTPPQRVGPSVKHSPVSTVLETGQVPRNQVDFKSSSGSLGIPQVTHVEQKSLEPGVRLHLGDDLIPFRISARGVCEAEITNDQPNRRKLSSPRLGTHKQGTNRFNGDQKETLVRNLMKFSLGSQDVLSSGRSQALHPKGQLDYAVNAYNRQDEKGQNSAGLEQNRQPNGIGAKTQPRSPQGMSEDILLRESLHSQENSGTKSQVRQISKIGTDLNRGFEFTLTKSVDVTNTNETQSTQPVHQRVFNAIVEHLQTSKPRHDVRFHLRTDNGEIVRVRMSIVSNVVRAKIAVTSSELREALATYGWELNQRLEMQGFVPNDLEFLLLGERDTPDRKQRRGQSHVLSDEVILDQEDDVEAVEALAAGFERWA